METQTQESKDGGIKQEKMSIMKWEPGKISSLMMKVRFFFKSFVKFFKRKQESLKDISWVLMNAVDTPTKLQLAKEFGNNGIKVYTDPNAQKNTMLVGYKGKQMLDSGYIYAPYVPTGGSPVIFDPYFEVKGKKDFEFDK